MGSIRALTLGVAVAAWTDPVAASRFEFSRTAMGTTIRVVMYADDAGPAQAAVEQAFGAVELVEAALSDYRPDSEISRLSDAAGGPAIPVSPGTAEALRAALRFAAQTQGAFDPTVAPLVRLWREARQTGRLPSSQAVQSARALVGYQQLGITSGTARLAKHGMRLDLGGIGKGIACDRALDVLRARGFTRALVAAGGDFALGDPPPGTAGWQIRIEGGPTLTLSRCGVSTSGDTEQHVVIGGRRYSHIIDPRTGKPVEGMGFVTVVAEHATASDAFATALAVLGPVDGLALATRRPGTHARIRWRSDAATRTVTTEGFDALVAPEVFRFVPGIGSRDLLLGEIPVWRTINGEPDQSATGFKVYTHLFDPATGARITGAHETPYPHHRGLWIGWQKVRDALGVYNFWEIPDSSQTFAGFMPSRERANADEAVETARIEWTNSAGRSVVHEIRELRARRVAPGQIRIDVTSELAAAGVSAVELAGDAQHAGCQIRLTAEAQGLVYLRPAHATPTGNDVWTNTDWTSARFTVRGAPVTIRHADDPGNPRPMEYSTRPYGRFGSRFATTLRPGVPQTFRWHLLLAGGSPAATPEFATRPLGAQVLFSGSGTGLWHHADGAAVRWTVSGGAMTVHGGDIFTTFPIADTLLHLEFRIPISGSELSGEARGNSGVYIQGRYEIQILDSYGRPPEFNGCGAIYRQRAPDTNASRPAGEWQTFDIEFRQPRWHADGTKAANARITVWHNGVLVHHDVEITAKTGLGAPEGPPPRPLKLQDHGHPVAFRNIWIAPL